MLRLLQEATLKQLGPIKRRGHTAEANKVPRPQIFTKVTGRVLTVGQARELDQRILRRRRTSNFNGPVGPWGVV